MIPKSDLEIGAYYRGRSRNATVARWDGRCFHYRRTKFGHTFVEEIMHPEDEVGFDCFEPSDKLEDPGVEIPLPGEA